MKHKIQKRPWGHYQVLHQEPNIQVKRIEIKPHLRLSLQKHLRRQEKWVIVSGSGVATIGLKKFPIKKGCMLEVARRQIHRLHNTGSKPLVFVEVQFGNYLEEDDVIRLADDFGRV